MNWAMTGKGWTLTVEQESTPIYVPGTRWVAPGSAWLRGQRRAMLHIEVMGDWQSADYDIPLRDRDLDRLVKVLRPLGRSGVETGRTAVLVFAAALPIDYLPAQITFSGLR